MVDMDVTCINHVYQKLEEVDKEVKDLIQELQTKREQLVVVIDMDFEVKERVWLHNIYQKVEDLGNDVDDIIVEVGIQVMESRNRVYPNIQQPNESYAFNFHANNQQVHANVSDDDEAGDGESNSHDSTETFDDLSIDSLRLGLKDVTSTWIDYIYQKFEEVGKEVGDIIQQLQINSKYLLDASMLDMDFELQERKWLWLNHIYHIVEELGKYVEHIIVEVGIQVLENGKRVSSDMQELLPLLNDPRKEESMTEESSIINFLKPNESHALNHHANNQQVHANVSDDDNDHDRDNSRETSGLSQDNLHVSNEQNGMKFSSHELKLALSEAEALVGEKEYSYGNIRVELEQDSCAPVEENDITPQVFDDLSPSDIEQVDAFIADEMFYCDDSDTWGIMSDISYKSPSMHMNSLSSSAVLEVIDDNVTVRNQELSSFAESSDRLFSSAMIMAKKVPLPSISSLVCRNPSVKSPMESDGINLADVAGCGYDSSMISQQKIVSCGGRPSVESNEGETLEPECLVPLTNFSEIKHGEADSVGKNAIISFSPDTDADLNTSLESNIADIHLTDDDESEQTWELIDDKEVHSIRHKLQGESTKRRILNYFGTKMMLSKGV